MSRRLVTWPTSPSFAELKSDIVEGKGYYLDDFKACRPSEFEALSSLLKADASRRKDILKVCLEDHRLGNLWTKLMCLDVVDSEFETSVHLLLAEQVYHVLFKGCLMVGKVLREGFSAAADSVMKGGSCSWTIADRKSVVACVGRLHPMGLKSNFSAEACAGASEFLSCCSYDKSMPKLQVEFFEKAVLAMTDPERYRLYRFITDQQYFSSTGMDVSMRLTKGSYPKASMCCKELYLPLVESAEEMVGLLNIACLHVEYGDI